MALDDTGTILVISPSTGEDTPVLAPYSARGLTQSLDLLPGNQRRTINGELIDLTPVQFRKYVSTITCTDQETPALDGAYVGQIVTVDCVKRLKYPSGGSPQRAVVSGSSVTADGFVSYRPQLLMMVKNINDSLAEWDADETWTIDLEEV